MEQPQRRPELTGIGRGVELEKLRALGPKELDRMTDIQLAEWQSEFKPGSPQAILAEHQWQNRLVKQQVKSAHFAAWMSLLGAVVGSAITYFAR
jgi:hypothetical protein